MTVLLSIDGVSKRFGDHQVLDAVSLAVAQGEFIALLGPSGCGKTTLLRLIAGFLTADAGRVCIDGEDVGRLPPHRRPLNTVFQHYALFPHMTVLDNVAYGPRRHGASRAEAHERARESLAMVGLADFAARYPRELSGGQQQRVALARAIVNRPKLLLLDEPLSALDMKLRKQVQLELKHLQARLGIAFVFVTHDQDEAMTMADRIVVMNGGRIEQVGSGVDIYRRPATRFVAEFIGEANLIPYRAATGGVRLALQQATVAATPPAAEGVAVLRPEHVRVLAAGTSAGCAVTGVLRDVVSVGSHTALHVDVDGNPIVARTMGLPPADMQPGRHVRLGFEPGDLHWIGARP